MKSNELGNIRCKECDDHAFFESAKQNGLYIYKCHMGLTEAVFPIIYENVMIAYMMIGQVFDGFKSEAEFEKILVGLKEISGEYNKIECSLAFSRLEEMPHEKIASVAKIMEVYASYIGFSDFIYTYIGGAAHLVKSFIEQNIDKPLNIEMIASTLNLGRTTVCVKFKENFHMTVNGFIIKTRLEKAKRLLRTTELSLAEISNECGFADYNYFIRIFNKHVGVTPFLFRRKL